MATGPIPPGATGISMQSAQAQASVNQSQTPLNPEEMWQSIVQPKRGFESNRFNADDEYRKIPAAPLGSRLDEGVRGGLVGHGSNTVGAVQLIDADGKRSWVGSGIFLQEGADHAEVVSLKGLTGQAPQRLEGARLVVVVDQVVCPDCRQKLIEYAQNVGASSIEIYHPRLENERRAIGSGIMKTPKGSSKASFRGPTDPPRPPLVVRHEETIKIKRPPPGGSAGGNLLPGGGNHMSSLEEAGHIRTAIIGTCANIAGAVAIGIFQDKFRAYMLSEIKRMPKPRVDTSGAKEFFSNPQSRKAINVINLLNKDVDPFARELAEHHQKVISVAAIELTLLRLSFIPDTEKLEFLKGLEAQLDAYDANLTIAEDNLEASQQVSIDAIETAKGGEAAAKIIGNIMVADELVQAGISVEEIVDTIEFFDHYSWRVRSAFDDLARLHAQVTRQRHELANIRSDLNLFFWQIVLSIAARDPQALRMVQHRNLDASAPTAKSSADPQNKPKSSADPQNKPKPVPVAPLR